MRKIFTFKSIVFYFFLLVQSRISAQSSLPVYNTDPTVSQIGWAYGSDVDGVSGNYDCGGNNVLRFNSYNANELAYVNFNSAATNVSFYIQRNSNKNKSLLVEESPNGITYTTVAKVTNTQVPSNNITYQLTYSLQNTSRYVRFRMTDNSGGAYFLDGIAVYNTAPPPCYCIPYFSTGIVYEYITNVNFAGINNNSTYEGYFGQYIDYTGGTSGNVTIGSASNLSVTINADLNDYVYAWIDWNQNGSFADPGEQYTLATNVSTNGPFTLSITPPAGAATGSTRMRVMIDYNNASPNPCRSATYGEAEDYRVIVSASTPCTGTPVGGTASASPASGIPGSVFTASVTGNTSGSGITYQWQSSPDGISGWTDIAGATSASSSITSVSTLTTTYYRLKITCTNSSLTGYSSVTSYITTYCTPTHTYDDTYNNITKVEFVGTQNDVSNTSGTSGVAYQDFTGLGNYAIQEQGEAINLNVFSNTASTFWNAWVDWNQDGDFNDAGEEVYNSNNILTYSTTFGFQVPIGQAPGNYRIRIRTLDFNDGFGSYYGYDNSDITPCGNLTDGQAEDYLFTVIARCNAQVATVKNDTACSLTSASFDLSVTGYNLGSISAFNWYSAQTGGSPVYTSAASGTPPSGSYTTPNLSTTTTYWVTAVGLDALGVSCESHTRAPVVAFKPTVPTITFNQANPTYLCDGEDLGVDGTSGLETGYLVDEGFEAGTTGEFTVSTTGTLTDPTNQPWVNHTSVFTPTMSSVWRPAVSSGFGSNKFLFALSDIINSNYYTTTLTSASHNTNSFTSLTLDFKLYYDHYLTDNDNTIQDSLSVQAYDGTGWNTLQRFTSDQGKASNMSTFTYNLGVSYLNKPNIKIRFIYAGNWVNGVAIDSIRLYGDRPASKAYYWTQVGGYIDNCLFTDPGFTTPYLASDTASQVYLQTTNAQEDDGNPLQFEAKLVTSNGCSVKDTILVDINNKIWTAGAGTDKWITDANWCGNQVPKLSDRVSIPNLGPSGPYPVIETGKLGKSKYLTIEPGASVTIDDGGTLQIKGDLTTQIGGAFTNNGTLLLAGTSNGTSQNFPGPGIIAEMNNLVIGNNANPPSGGSNIILNTPISIRGRFRDSLGTLELGNNDITIKSYASGTGYFDKITDPSAGINMNGTGRFIVERYIPPRRAWRFLTAPFYSTTQSINQAWQEGQQNLSQPTTCPTTDPAPDGYGLYITNAGTAGGYDWNTTNNPSLKIWQNTSGVGQWVPPASTLTTNMLDYPAYCVFVRGDRHICIQDATSAVPNPTVLRIRGVLNEPGTTGLSYLANISKSYSGTPGDVFFIGNPYASAVDLTDVLTTQSTGIANDKAWFWDPNANGPAGYNVGAYVTYSNGVWTLPNPLYPQDLILRSGEAFFVQLSLSQSSASVNFNQADKDPASETGIFGKKKPQPVRHVIYTRLLTTQNNVTTSLDMVATAFGNEFSAAIDSKDAPKLWNVDENMSLVRDNSNLSIEFRPIPQLTDTIFYRLYLRNQPYTLQIFSQNLPGNLPAKAWLIDKYLKTRMEVNLYDTTLYNFTPVQNSDGSMDTNSYRNRFMLVFNRQFNADAVPVSKVIDQNNQTGTGEAMNLHANNGTVSIYPNPVTKFKTTLQFNGMLPGEYETSIYNSKGQKLGGQLIQNSGGHTNYDLLIPPSWAAGIYVVRVLNKSTGKSINLKLVVSK